LYREGREALDRIRSCRDWGDWEKVAFAVDAARSEAMKIADTNKPVGSRYYKAFGEVLRREELHTDKLDSAVRNLLFKIVKHRVVIEEWRQRLDPKRRNEINFPRIVLNNWGKTPEGRAALNPPKPGGNQQPQATAPRRPRNHAQLLNENVELEEQVRRLTDERDQLKRQAAADFVEPIKALNSLFHQGRVRIDDLRSAALGFDADALDELAATIKKLADEWRKKVA